MKMFSKLLFFIFPLYVSFAVFANEQQIHIKARLVEVTKVTKDIGKSYTGFLGQMGKDGKMLLWTNPLDVFPGITTSSTRGLQNPDPTNVTVTAVLTDVNSRVAFHYLELRPGFENLAEPKVVTTSGRRTEMRASAYKSIVTNSGPPRTATLSPQSETIKFEGVLEMDANVLTDGCTIDLKTTASLTNFLDNDEMVHRFYLRQTSAHLYLSDGQTVVLRNLPKHFYVGGKEVNTKPDADDTELLVFITLTMIDPAGNRVHTEDEMPSAQTRVPPQPPQPK